MEVRHTCLLILVMHDTFVVSHVVLVRDFVSMHLKKRRLNLRRILFLNMLVFVLFYIARGDHVADTSYIRRLFDWESTDEFNIWNAQVS